jgi:molecular chaperone DnaK (HSP70)
MNLSDDIIHRAMDTARNITASAMENQEGLELVIGIDFGTTYTGVAYAISSNTTEPLTLARTRSLLNRMVLVTQWPTADGLNTDKTPSVLAYDKATGAMVAWGGIVMNRHEMNRRKTWQVTHFKLGLEVNVRRHYTRGSALAQSEGNGFLDESDWQHPSLPNKSAVDFTADFLRAVHDFLKSDQVLRNQFGPEFMSRLTLSYALTVPAIWSDKAKEASRQAALRAGIPENRLTLITEPEAAAAYCSTLFPAVDLKEGDRFLVCDAGGGTVV